MAHRSGHKAQKSSLSVLSLRPLISPTSILSYARRASPRKPEIVPEALSRSQVTWSAFSRIVVGCICVTFVTLLFATSWYWIVAPRVSTPIGFAPKFTERSRAQDALLGHPMQRYRDNLKVDARYITSWVCAGWTNDVIALGNMLYIALLAERIPIMPPFAPSHLPQNAGFVAFGDVFDVPRLSKALRVPILEWRDVKDENSTAVEEVGCWSAWLGGGRDVSEPRASYIPGLLNLDISYTPVPYSFKAYGDGDYHILQNRLMQLAFPSGRTSALSEVSSLPAPFSGIVIPPDEQLMCFDYLYYTSVERNFEWETDWSPQWRLVGRHMTWARKLESLAEEYLRRHFVTPEKEPVPPFISVHARRGDFKLTCANRNETCLPTLSEMRARIEEVQDLSLDKSSTVLLRVLVMSDELDPAWWEAVKAEGWGWIDHTLERTEEKYGKWYVPLLDAVFLSRGAGLVGTKGSTMSLLAQRRVEDWHGGPSVFMSSRA